MIEPFSKDFSSLKEQYKTSSQKYEDLDGKDELIAKIESLGNRLGPSLTAVAWQKKQKYFAKVVKTSSRSKSAGRMPRLIYESNAILQLDGTDATQNAFTGQIPRPPTITAEAVVRVKQGRKVRIDRRHRPRQWWNRTGLATRLWPKQFLSCESARLGDGGFRNQRVKRRSGTKGTSRGRHL